MMKCVSIAQASTFRTPWDGIDVRKQFEAGHFRNKNQHLVSTSATKLIVPARIAPSSQAHSSTNGVGPTLKTAGFEPSASIAARTPGAVLPARRLETVLRRSALSR
jgi:hypothetical protein